MATQPKTRCAEMGCNRLGTTARCEEHTRGKHRDDDRRRGSASRRGYDAVWRKFRRMYLAEHPLCVDCREKGRTKAAKEVHHLSKLTAGGARLCACNVVGLCKGCHNARTAKGE